MSSIRTTKFRFTNAVMLVIWLNGILTLSLDAGPPYLTDDPEPTDYHHWETYLFTLGETTQGAYSIQGPAYEINYGGFPDTQLSLTLPLSTAGGDGMATVSGIGDIELGVKYRFVHETNGWPQIAFYPAVFLPTGDASRGLGFGRPVYQLPIWAQKNWEEWTLCGGGGVNLNSSVNQFDSPFGGLLLQRAIGKRFSVGGEVYAQGAETNTDRGFIALNAGAIYQINEHFSILGSVGHSVVGDDHLLWYFALGINW